MALDVDMLPDLPLESLEQWTLALAFGTAAAGKARSLPAFIGYLQLPLRSFARWVAASCIAFEGAIAVGFLVPSWADESATLAWVFLVVASCYLSWRLQAADETACRCWGGSQASQAISFDFQPEASEVTQNILAPAWYGLRNGTLALLAGDVAIRSMTSEMAPRSWEMFAAFAVCPAVVSIGLMVSIAARRSLPALAVHPRKQMLAPRLAPLVALSWYSGRGDSGI